MKVKQKFKVNYNKKYRYAKGREQLGDLSGFAIDHKIYIHRPKGVYSKGLIISLEKMNDN